MGIVGSLALWYEFVLLFLKSEAPRILYTNNAHITQNRTVHCIQKQFGKIKYEPKPALKLYVKMFVLTFYNLNYKYCIVYTVC